VIGGNRDTGAPHGIDLLAAAGHPVGAGEEPQHSGAVRECVYLAVMSLDPTGQGRRRWVMRWKPALNAFDMTLEGRLSAGRK
jgi:hypothetical protein